MDHQSNIAWILKAINEGLHSGKWYGELNTTLPEKTTIDPDKFNRMTVSIAGDLYAISVFRPAEAPVSGNDVTDLVAEGRISVNEARSEATAEPLDLTTELSAGIRLFLNDHRANPKLHKLYISWALHDLGIIDRALEEMREVSRWPMSFIASALQEAVTKEILDDAAWFEAAALRYSRADTSEYDNLERKESLEGDEEAES